MEYHTQKSAAAVSKQIPIIILERDNNRRGDLFGRLMSDLFVSLGYDNIRLNVARSGREIDILAEHRLENRTAMAECKAVEEKIGGKEINAFAGKLRAEQRREPKRPITPYFISLSGFTETGIDQEKEAGEEAIILVDGSRAVEELILGRMLVPLDQAVARAAQLVPGRSQLDLDPEPELLTHQSGWVWAIYFSQRKQRTHVVLVHADGTPLARSVATEIIAAEPGPRRVLRELTCLNPEPAPPAEQFEAAAREKYFKYLAAECGYILLDGMPADAEVGSKRLHLENLFVPLRLIGSGVANPVSVGEFLSENSRIAILASPGAGKSTLLKRLAVAYSDPNRRMLIEDQLPERTWLPLFFRCRELRDKTRSPFPDLITVLAERAYLGEFVHAFRDIVDQALRNGEVLLLIDGLDEVTDTGDRTAFVRNLRSFLAIYPNISLVVSSREVGFRHVSGLLATVCVETRLADFDDDDIRLLTVAWHREVIGDRPEVIAEAERLAQTIVANDRIRRLAGNPLLHTTLLLVKRWVGQLPTLRSVLYGKAVEVLLMTWNVEGHEPIEQEEALPQLCYVAYSMMRDGVQKISRPELTRRLREAREQLSAELAYARIGIADFIERIEDRSSLLMMVGHEIEDGTLTEIYEFRHLTFQEYLTARAIAQGWYPDHQETDTLVGTLEPHFEDESWQEVIPLAAVLAGRNAEGLLHRLTALVELHLGTIGPDKPLSSEQRLPAVALSNCLADEVKLTPATLAQAARTVIRSYYPAEFYFDIDYASRGKFRTVFYEQASVLYFKSANLRDAGYVLGKIVYAKATSDQAVPSLRSALPYFLVLLGGGSEQRCEAALGIVVACPITRPQEPQFISALCTCAQALIPMLFSEEPTEQFAAAWAFSFVGLHRAWTPPPRLIERLFTLWQGDGQSRVRAEACLAFAMTPLLDRSHVNLSDPGDSFKVRAETLWKDNEFSLGCSATLIAAYYLRTPWTDDEIYRLASHSNERHYGGSQLRNVICGLEQERAASTTAGSPDIQ